MLYRRANNPRTSNPRLSREIEYEQGDVPVQMYDVTCPTLSTEMTRF